MLEGKRVAVVIPAYNEEKLLAATIEGIPNFVDTIYVVDDASRDGTVEAARNVHDRRVHNLGVTLPPVSQLAIRATSH